MKKLFTLLLLSLASSHTFAQEKAEPQSTYNNTFGISSGSMVFSRLGYFTSPSSPVSQVGVTYERKIWRSFSISGGFYTWTNKNGRVYDQRSARYTEYNSGTWTAGAISKRTSYNTLELVPEYAFHFNHSKDVITIGAGVSYTFGKNVYTDYFVPGIAEEYHYPAPVTHAAYLGNVYKASYTHFFLHNRLGVGAGARFSYYYNLYEGEYDLDAHVKVNF